MQTEQEVKWYEKHALLLGIISGIIFGMIVHSFFISLGNERDIHMLTQRVKNLEINNNIEYR
jgi:hypothetical protein